MSRPGTTGTDPGEDRKIPHTPAAADEDAAGGTETDKTTLGASDTSGLGAGGGAGVDYETASAGEGASWDPAEIAEKEG